MKAALYARFSTDLQRTASIEDQFRNCRKRAELEGWTIVATFADAAMSGSDANRPRYRAMLEAAAPKTEWVEHRDESLRIIPDSLLQRAQARTRVATNSDKRLKSGGRARYLLSGLLICNV